MSKAILTAVLGKLYNLPAEEITESLKDSDLQETSNSDQKVIDLILGKQTEVTGNLKKQYKEFGHKDGFKKGAESIEKAARTKYGIEDDTITGVELVDLIAEKIKTETEANAKKSGKSGDDFKKHPDYLALEKRVQDAEKDKKAAVDKALEALKGEYKTKEITGRKRDLANELIAELKPILSEDPAKAKRQIEMFLNEVAKANVDASEDGQELLLVGEDGQPVVNDQGFTVNYKEFAKSQLQASFDFPAATQRDSSQSGNSGNNKGGDGKGGNKVLPKAKDLNELAELLEKSEYSPEEKLQMNTDFFGAAK